MLTIIGGTYREVCLSPDWDAIWGSGFRAAIALQTRFHSIQLITCTSDADRKHINNYATDTENGGELSIRASRRRGDIEWQYDHSLASPRLLTQNSKGYEAKPIKLHDNSEHKVRDSVLLFSFIEFDDSPKFKARRVVYDPQAGSKAAKFPREICQADQLALVLNLTEARAIASDHGIQNTKGMGPNKLAKEILRLEHAECVVIKNGIFGAHVSTGKHSTQHIAAYKTPAYFGIGSGDIFSAVFAGLWMEENCDPFEAAKTASAATAWYCSHNGIIPLPGELESLGDEYEQIDLERIKFDGMPKTYGVGRVYLAGPFFSLSQKWLINQALVEFYSKGLEVWSPSLESGILSDKSTIEDVERVVTEDLEALETCGSVFACVENMDPGTMFEIGYAVKKGLPVTVYAENMKQSDPTMLEGTACALFDDFASAVTHAIAVAYKL